MATNRNKSSFDLVDSPQAELAVEAHHLRVLVRDVSHRLVNNLESDIVELIEMVGDVSSDSDKELRKMVHLIQSLAVKPNKGRLRDLKRIRNLVRDLNLRLEELV